MRRTNSPIGWRLKYRTKNDWKSSVTKLSPKAINWMLNWLKSAWSMAENYKKQSSNSTKSNLSYKTCKSKLRGSRPNRDPTYSHQLYWTQMSSSKKRITLCARIKSSDCKDSYRTYKLITNKWEKQWMKAHTATHLSITNCKVWDMKSSRPDSNFRDFKSNQML